MRTSIRERKRSLIPPQPGAAPRPPHRPRRRRRRTIALLAALFFFGPNLAGAVGVEPRAIENRPLRQFPAADAGWRFLSEMDGWAVDHLPLRDRAVRADAAITEELFREAPFYGAGSPQVLPGRDGWLFYADEIAWRCQPVASLDDVWQAVGRFAELVDAAGSRLMLVVVPDKSSIESAMLPASYPRQQCGTASDAALWARLGSQPPPGYLDVRSSLERLRDNRGHAYYRTDTHWTPAGAAEYARLISSRIDPRLWASTQLVSAGPVRKRTDLTLLSGRPRNDTVPGVSVRRDGVSTRATTTKVGDRPVVHSTASSTNAPLYAARTLLLGDSFSSASVGQLAPFFADLTVAHWDLARADPALAAQLISDSPLVIVEVVQRHFGTGRTTLFDAEVLQNLQARLSAAPATTPAAPG